MISKNKTSALILAIIALSMVQTARAGDGEIASFRNAISQIQIYNQQYQAATSGSYEEQQAAQAVTQFEQNAESIITAPEAFQGYYASQITDLLNEFNAGYQAATSGSSEEKAYSVAVNAASAALLQEANYEATNSGDYTQSLQMAIDAEAQYQAAASGSSLETSYRQIAQQDWAIANQQLQDYVNNQLVDFATAESLFVSAEAEYQAATSGSSAESYYRSAVVLLKNRAILLFQNDASTFDAGTLNSIVTDYNARYQAAQSGSDDESYCVTIRNLAYGYLGQPQAMPFPLPPPPMRPMPPPHFWVHPQPLPPQYWPRHDNGPHPVYNGPHNNGPVNNGPVYNGPVYNGPVYNTPVYRGGNPQPQPRPEPVNPGPRYNPNPEPRPNPIGNNGPGGFNNGQGPRGNNGQGPYNPPQGNNPPASNGNGQAPHNPAQGNNPPAGNGNNNGNNNGNHDSGNHGGGQNNPPAANPPVRTAPPVATQPAPQPPRVTPPVATQPAPQPPRVTPPVATQPAPQPPRVIPPVATQPAPQPPRVTPPVATQPAPQPPRVTPPVATQPAPQPPRAAPPVVTQPAPQPPRAAPPVATQPAPSRPAPAPVAAPTAPSGGPRGPVGPHPH